MVTDPLSEEKRGRRVSSGLRIWQSVGTRVGENRDVTWPDCRDFYSEFGGVIGFFVGGKLEAQGQIRF